MQLSTWSKGALVLAALAFDGAAQTPSPKLDCDHVLMVANGLTSTCEMRESTLDAIGTLLVANSASGGISVDTWDGGQTLVRTRILAAAGSESQAAAIASQVRIAVSPGEVRASGPASRFNERWSATFEIYVPADTALRISTIDGGISVRAVTGPIVASTVNGGIAVTGAMGNVTATAVNGGVSISAAAPWREQTISANTVNGAVDLAVPEDCSAHVGLSTVNGNISTTIPGVTWAVSGRRGSVSFVLGGGESRISAATVNGSIEMGLSK